MKDYNLEFNKIVHVENEINQKTLKMALKKWISDIINDKGLHNYRADTQILDDDIHLHNHQVIIFI